MVPHRHSRGMRVIIPGSKTSQGNPQVILVLDEPLIAYAQSVLRPKERDAVATRAPPVPSDVYFTFAAAGIC